MKRRTLMWGLTLAVGCSPPMMTMNMDSGVDSGVPMPSMLTATDMLTGTIAAPKPTVGYDAMGNTGTFVLRGTASGMPFKADINMRFGGAPTATTYTSSSAGFSCNVTVTRGSAAADTWVALFNQPPQADKGTCSLTLSSAAMGATGYDVAGTLSIVADTQGGASSGMVTLMGTF